MAINTTPVSPEAFHPYPDSASNTPFEGTADAGDFFSTLLDIINPLQHIPLVSNLYRELTGDEIEPAARLVGGAVFGGPIGFASATANVLIEQASGDDVLGHAMALFSDDSANMTSPDGADLLARAPIDPDPEPEQELVSARTTGIEDIIWSGARTLPARTEVIKTPLNQIVMADSSANESVESEAANAEPTAPEWLAQSHMAAQREQTARATGDLTPEPAARPWVANAMFEALDKYEALSRARAEKSGTDSGS
jgi:hypothetical protein